MIGWSIALCFATLTLFLEFHATTLKVKVFAWSPNGDQFFWFRETFLQIKSPASKF